MPSGVSPPRTLFWFTTSSRVLTSWGQTQYAIQQFKRRRKEHKKQFRKNYGKQLHEQAGPADLRASESTSRGALPVEAQRQEVLLFRRLNRILLGWYKLVSQALERNRTLTDVTELQSSGDFANKVLLSLVTCLSLQSTNVSQPTTRYIVA